jgi:prolyl oligopeptidase
MPGLAAAPPVSAAEPVTEMLHGVSISDPYRWLEEQDSPRTRQWIEDQTQYARAYLDNLPGRHKIRERIREFLAVETYDSVQKAGNRYFFRKRLPDQEQPAIYLREGADGEDRLLIDPAQLGTGKYTAVKPLRISPDGRLLLYEIKQGGERTGTFALLNIETRTTLADVLPRGYLRGFAFALDGNSFYYVHEPVDSKRPFYRAVHRHVFGTGQDHDEEIFCAGDSEKTRLCLISEGNRLGFLVYKSFAKTRTEFYLRTLHSGGSTQTFVAATNYVLCPLLVPGKLLALTDRNAANFRIVELRVSKKKETEWDEIVPESDARINQWVVAGDHIFVSYIRQRRTEVSIFDFSGKKIGELTVPQDHSVRFVGCFAYSDELLFETESFAAPASIWRYSEVCGKQTNWAKKNVPLDAADYADSKVSYTSKDGTQIPMALVGRRDVLEGGSHPTIMTSYGGFGVSMTPQFSVFVAFLVERGCLFALPNIRGGSEFGADWHNAAIRRNRQVAYDDFLSAAEWLVDSGRTRPDRLAIFGGSNSGLLAGAAMTQRPDLFRAVVCMVPMLDMLRYHLFDGAHIWRDEYGSADDPEDFAALARYSPYHQVREGVAYPATMIVSGDADGNCNPLHARKMTARLQAANASPYPIFLDYSPFRGHSPVLPLSERIEALTDRMAFLCDQMQLPVRNEKES